MPTSFPITNPWVPGESVTSAKLQARTTTPLNDLYTLMSTTMANLPAASKSGNVNITPVANTPTSASVTFPTSRFTAAPTVIATPVSTLVGTVVTGCGSSNSSTTGALIWVTRTNTTLTGVNWLAQQDAS